MVHHVEEQGQDISGLDRLLLPASAGSKSTGQRRDIMTDMAHDPGQRNEGQVARTIEKHTAALPSDTFLWTAMGVMALSAGLQIMGNRQVSNFIGQWAPTLLLLGLYNKMVKLHGSEPIA
jgi:hypothetical protein